MIGITNKKLGLYALTSLSSGVLSKTDKYPKQCSQLHTAYYIQLKFQLHNNILDLLCDELANVTHANITFEFSDPQNYVDIPVINTTVTYVCEWPYFIRSGNSAQKCQEDRTWNGSQPYCSSKILSLYLREFVCVFAMVALQTLKKTQILPPCFQACQSAAGFSCFRGLVLILLNLLKTSTRDTTKLSHLG